MTPTQILSSSGAATLKIHSAVEADFPEAQCLEKVHKIGCHHIVTNRDGGVKAASVGFGGEAKLWSFQDGVWTEDSKIISACPIIAYAHWIGYQAKEIF